MNSGSHCPICGFEIGNGGWLRCEFPVGSRYFGWIYRCPACNTGDNLSRKLQKMSQLTGWLEDATFAHYEIVDGNREAAHACMQIASAGKKGWLVIYGSYGCGKTHLLASTVRACIERKIPAVYFTSANLLDRLRAGYNDDSHDELMDRLEAIDLLAIDEFDIDKIHTTPWALSKLYQLLDARYRHVLTKTTLFSMQYEPKLYDPGDSAAVFNYVHDRMIDGRSQVIKITSGDYRPVMREMAMDYADS
jgi:DNA replication protein DnaC